MTYADDVSDVSGDEQGDISTPTEPTAEPTGTAETTDTAHVDNNNDENKANPDTGASGCAVVVGLTVAAGGVLLLSRKHR